MDGAREVGPVADQGHDGWDNRITTDANGRPHMSGIDPTEFGGQGVEYYALGADGQWQIESVGSGPQTYKFATSVAVAPDGTPYITYHSQQGRDLAIASRTGGVWEIELIEEEGDTGLFAELVIDGSGRFHVSYLERTSGTSGTVKYATRASVSEPWTISEVDTLDNLSFGQVGARNITAIDMDSLGTPWIAYTDTSELMVAALDGDSWRTQRVAEPGARSLGQLVSLAVDDDGGVHVTYFEGPPTQGTVFYAKGTPAP